MIHIDEHFGGQVRRAGLACWKRIGRNGAPCALFDGLAHLFPHSIGGGPGNHRPQRRRGIERIAEDVFASHVRKSTDNAIEMASMHVNAFDRAARLPGIEERAIGKILDGIVQVRIGSNISRILSAELQADSQKHSRAGRFNFLPGVH